MWLGMVDLSGERFRERVHIRGPLAPHRTRTRTRRWPSGTVTVIGCE